jgi:hypothetical protein
MAANRVSYPAYFIHDSGLGERYLNGSILYVWASGAREYLRVHRILALNEFECRAEVYGRTQLDNILDLLGTLTDCDLADNSMVVGPRIGQHVYCVRRDPADPVDDDDEHNSDWMRGRWRVIFDSAHTRERFRTAFDTMLASGYVVDDNMPVHLGVSLVAPRAPPAAAAAAAAAEAGDDASTQHDDEKSLSRVSSPRRASRTVATKRTRSSILESLANASSAASSTMTPRSKKPAPPHRRSPSPPPTLAELQQQLQPRVAKKTAAVAAGAPPVRTTSAPVTEVPSAIRTAINNALHGTAASSIASVPPTPSQP